MKTFHLLLVTLAVAILISACGPEPTLDPALLQETAWQSHVEMDKADTAIVLSLGPWLIGLVVILGLATAVVCASPREQRQRRLNQGHARKWWPV